jgi:soluble lytic murein transglycosylase-like protein
MLGSEVGLRLLRGRRALIIAMLPALAFTAELRAQPAPPPAEAPAEAVPPAESKPKSETELCTVIESAAKAHGLPVAFFTRLIWKESRFRTDAVSPKGAQGIAQFMPGTAEERGLLDPFDPFTALPASASLLADLSARFGNLGLAAAAYNAGAQRVTNWLAETSTLPWETQDYVASITGIAAETWADKDKPPELPAEMQTQDCAAVTAS